MPPEDPPEFRQSKRSHLRFRIVDLIHVTVIVSLLLTIVRYAGPYFLIAACGVLVAYLSFLGVLEPIQTEKWRWRIRAVGLVIFGTSFFLPAAPTFSPSFLWGFQAAQTYFGALWERTFSLHDPNILGFIHLFSVNLANLFVPFTVILLWNRGQRIEPILKFGFCLILPAVWAMGTGIAPLLVGYYFWALSTILLVSTFSFDRTSFTLLVVATGIQFSCLIYGEIFEGM